jgi:exodeoxyribonuclease VII large subunit
MNNSFQSILSFGSEDPFSVGELTGMIKQAIAQEPRLHDVRVVGEMTNVSRAASGHAYFSLRDGTSILPCVMWKSSVMRLKRFPHDCVSVLARGSVTVYELGGKYQLDAKSLVAIGEGDAAATFEELKARLAEEGLFAQERKRPIPAMPNVIGIVTSPTGAALQDVINVLRTRWPLAELIVSPTLVQGDAAPREIIAAIRRVEARCDVLIIARGGGSAEDLAAFNDEDVVRAVASVMVPVVSGVGHEIDWTLTDLAADLRAPTPSAAAMVVSPQIEEIRQRIDDSARAVDDLLSQHVESRRSELLRSVHALRVLSPQQRLNTARRTVGDLRMRIDRAEAARLAKLRAAVTASFAQLKALDPTAVLERGYSIVRAVDGRILRSIDASHTGDRLSVQMRDGTFGVTRE